MKTNFLLLLLAFCLGTFSLHAQDAADDSFYSLDKIQSVEIDLPYPNWAYLLDSLRFNGDGLLLGNVSINGTSFENVGVRYSETNVFQPGEKRNNLYIQLDYIDQSQKIEGHTQVHLSNALRDPSMVREVLSFAIARTYMPAPQANYANVSINDELVGLYVNVEPIGKAFLERNFGSSDGACFKARSFRKNDQFPDNCKQKLYGSLEYDSGGRVFPGQL
jgi:spore coat protein CotH